MKVGDTCTFAGIYEPESWWARLKRWLGMPMPPKRLREYRIGAVVTNPD